jgi:DNA-binding response OmpR family regulator
VSNAIKFTPEGGILRISGHLQESGFVCIGVHDSGIGIAPQHQAQIFERFKQIGNVLTDRPQGTGLGLPICKQIVEYLGGRIWVESELGNGSTFWFTVPVANAREELSAAVVDEPQPGVPSILVVEDDAATRQILRYTFESRGFDVITASHAEEAVRLARERRPSLVTLDIVMPGGSGFDVLRAIRADASLASTRVVLLSVVADGTNGRRALKLGANAYLAKPFDADGLIRTVEQLVSRDRRDALVICEDAAEGAPLKSSLRDQGFRVVEALDADSGVTFAQRYPPDVILLQAAASNEQTKRILEQLRNDRATERVPVVLLAGDAIADGAAVYLGGWSEALRSDTTSIGDLLTTLVERFAASATPAASRDQSAPTA